MVDGDGPLFEVAVVHHTECGTGFLADASFRTAFGQVTGTDEAPLQCQAAPSCPCRSGSGGR